ncbi:putative endonuclease [Scopulibacillus darangshiensis]|uniref:Putative endonuclease n=1 Tax=Scopulibacillus darangshiensis TaxID=442528 RepID=A0A4R2NM47_9BACL|nr:GIY-YIG nuclease family protein [Scopulibacillus darangshiensis]TCP22562.1 putative endonuclease [Scopulibacillus darangshiensis]
MADNKTYAVYILECADGSYYTGYTTNVERRLKVHSDGKGAKYTRIRRPLSLIYEEWFDDKSEALKREHAIKKLSKRQKVELVKGAKA